MLKDFTIVGDSAGIPTTRCGGSPEKKKDKQKLTEVII